MSKHFWISFIKSSIRIAGFIFLLENIFLAVGTLIVAELIGIIEELYE